MLQRRDDKRPKKSGAKSKGLDLGAEGVKQCHQKVVATLQVAKTASEKFSSRRRMSIQAHLKKISEKVAASCKQCKPA